MRESVRTLTSDLFFKEEQLNLMKEAIIAGNITMKAFDAKYCNEWHRSPGRIGKKMSKMAKLMKTPIPSSIKYTKSEPKPFSFEKRSIIYYTKEEIEIIKAEITKGIPLVRIAQDLTKVFTTRTYDGILSKVNSVAQTMDCPQKLRTGKFNYDLHSIKQELELIKTEKVKQQAPSPLKLTLPEGMTYEGMAKRVELCHDHFRIYF